MRITIGNRTRKLMGILSLEKYPFSVMELKKAYIEQVKQWHPDLHQDNIEKIKFEKRTQQINEAYKELYNFALYEETEDPRVKQVENEDDIFKLWKKCNRCHGTGKEEYYEYIEKESDKNCSYCNGTGEKIVYCKYCNGTGKYTQARSKKVVDCLACNGTGVYKKVKCFMCVYRTVLQGFGFNPHINHERVVKLRPCHYCNGKGKIELDLFNPVIKKGAVMI